MTVISSTSNIDVDPYAYVCIIRNGKYETHYIDEELSNAYKVLDGLNKEINSIKLPLEY